METYCRAEQATDDNMAHTLCMQDTQGCRMLIAFPVQQWLRERSPMLHYAHIACLVRKHVSRGGRKLYTI